MRAEKTLRNRSIHHKTTKNSRGISPVISTIIISGTLLIILVIASFVSANILELQVSSAEFEQAKTNMMLLDDVIQDVALRLGAGGYVQFNQRSGGIGITENPENIRILGPGEQLIVNTTIIRSPTSTSGDWTNGTNAYADGGGYANIQSGKPSSSQNYSGYGFTIPSSASIVKVRVRIDAWTDGDENITLQVSPDGGSIWTPPTSIGQNLNTTETTYWFDITSYAAWTPTAVNQIQTRVAAYTVGSKNSLVDLDWIPVEVTYASNIIYESPSSITLVYRGGSHVSGADTTLRGDNTLWVDMTNPTSHLRVETGQGVQIKLDYNRVRIIPTGELDVGGILRNFIEITFIRLVRGNMGGSGVVNVKVQNIGIKTVPHQIDGGNLTIQVQLGSNTTDYTVSSQAQKTVVMFTEILVQLSTA